jgi:hypothetical protein
LGPARREHRLAIDGDWVTDYSERLFDVGLVAQLRIATHAYVDFEIPVGYAQARTWFDDVVLGNPTLGFHGSWRFGPHAELHVGGSFTVPTNVVGAEDTDAGAKTYAAWRLAFARAGDALQRFYPIDVDLRAPLGVELAFRPLFARVDAVPLLAIYTDRYLDDATVLFFTQSVELELRAPFGLGAGGRAQVVLEPMEPARDRALLGVEPFLAFEPEPRGPFARVGVLFSRNRLPGIDLAPPLATVHATLGAKW